MQNYYQQNPYQFRQYGYRVIPVSNEMEVNNTTVEYNGNPTYFHNQATNEIYVKYFDIKTGCTPIQKYIKSENAEHDLSHVKEENSINPYEEKFNALNERLDSLFEIVNSQQEKEGKK